MLIFADYYFLGGLAFIVGSVCDTLDGRYSRMSGKGTSFGAFLDSTLDRMEEGIVLTAVAYQFSQAGNDAAVAAVVVAVLASLMVSYTRARAEALGVECKVGIADRAVRVVILSAGLVLAKGAGDPRRGAARAGRLAARRAVGDHRRPAHLPRAPGADARRRRCNDRPPAGSVTRTRSATTRYENLSTNGKGRYQEDKVRVAIIGVGNCASSFVQGVQYYKDADPAEQVPGLMHVDLGGYHVRDIEFSAAFDIDAEKVGKDLSEAIFAGQNNTLNFAGEIPNLGVPVQRGMTHDGLGKYLSQKIEKAPGSTVDIAQVLKDTRTDVVVSYLPVGSEQATKWYVEQILEAGCGFVNCIPVFIAREDYWNNRFVKAGLPIVGDDIKSQVGATIVHRRSRACSTTAASSCCARRSSTSAATWTSSTCSSASGWSPRRSPRPTRSRRSWATSCPPTTSTSARRTTCRG